MRLYQKHHHFPKMHLSMESSGQLEGLESSEVQETGRQLWNIGFCRKMALGWVDQIPPQ